MSERASKGGHVEQLWAAPDGTACFLATCDTPPMYSVTLVRDTKVLRERRLYGHATARMVAEDWCDASQNGDI
jgi:hypothetical protein